MKTIYYTLTTWEREELAAGFDGGATGKRQVVLTRQPDPADGRLGGDNVIDLTQWRWESPDEPLDELAQGGWEDEAPDEPEPAIPTPRPRRNRRTMMTAELVSTISVVAAALALIVRVLTF